MTVGLKGFATHIVHWQRQHGRNSLPWLSTIATAVLPVKFSASLASKPVSRPVSAAGAG
mgnify:CR=1 FL=1